MNEITIDLDKNVKDGKIFHFVYQILKLYIQEKIIDKNNI